MGRPYGQQPGDLAAAGTYGVPMKAAAEKLEEFEGYKEDSRSSPLDRVTVIDDSYNASPVSMKAGLEVLCSVWRKEGRSAVLADMKELGADAPGSTERSAHIAVHPADQVDSLGTGRAEIGDELLLWRPNLESILKGAGRREINGRWLDEPEMED